MTAARVTRGYSGRRLRRCCWSSPPKFIGSNLLLAGLLATSAAAIFPVVLHSTLAPENSLSAYDVAAGASSLAYAAIWWPIGFALAAAYFVFVSRQYAGKVSVQRDDQGFY